MKKGKQKRSKCVFEDLKNKGKFIKCILSTIVFAATTISGISISALLIYSYETEATSPEWQGTSKEIVTLLYGKIKSLHDSGIYRGSFSSDENERRIDEMFEEIAESIVVSLHRRLQNATNWKERKSRCSCC